MEGQDTIHAIATPPGVGGIGIVRISGPGVERIAKTVLGSLPQPRVATFARFAAADGATIDTGIALYFPAPASLTGEDVLELQGHGGPMVLQLLSDRVAEAGSRPARPGEFLERAFLNDKIDLVQAEAVADLIESGTEAAARAAQRSLEGVFSERVHALAEQLNRLRVFVEASLDFPDEEIDFLADSDVEDRLRALAEANRQLIRDARQGRLLRDGITVAIAGRPNAGKSTLLNALAGREAAIVTDIPGTTRDVLRETISLGGMPVHIADTAGLREAVDEVEAEGVRRARQELNQADIVLLVLDAEAPLEPQRELRADVPATVPCIEVVNKIDLYGDGPAIDRETRLVSMSARTGAGLDLLVTMIRETVGLWAEQGGSFSARSRHLDALRRVGNHLNQGTEQLQGPGAAEVLAEELRLAQRALGEITGEVLPDDLLGAIFSSFCIGK